MTLSPVLSILFHPFSKGLPLRHCRDGRTPPASEGRMAQGDARARVLKVGRQGRRLLLRAVQQEVQAVPRHHQGK
jgi:hypothetical protein